MLTVILRRVAVVVAVVFLLTLPLNISDRFWLTMVTTAGVYAVGAVGLNLLTGYLGEASLGHAFFMGLGAYVGILAGQMLQMPLLLWMLVVLVIGGIAGAVTGLLALRLSGGYLLMVTFALIYLGQWIFANWRSVTGGPSGKAVDLPLAVGPIDFDALVIGQTQFSPSQGFAVLVWVVCAVAILVVRNISKSRTGLAMRAIHDNPTAASSAGISLYRAKMGGFIVSSALAALAGAFYAQQLGYLEPAAFGLFLSIQFMVILFIGGAGTTFGPVVGAAFVAAVPLLLQRLDWLPFVLSPVEPGVGFTASELSSLLFALALLAFLLAEPGGIVRLVSRLVRRVARFTSRRELATIGE